MKATLIAAALALAAGTAISEDAVLRGPGGEYRLTNKPCTLPIALAAVKPEHADKQRAGRLTTKERVIQLCWLTDGDVVWAMDEDGRLHRGQTSDFEPDAGV